MDIDLSLPEDASSVRREIPFDALMTALESALLTAYYKHAARSVPEHARFRSTRSLGT